MDLVALAWAVLAMVFFLAEIFTAGFVLACFGFGAAVAAVLAFFGFGLAGQLAAFVVLSTVAVVVSRPLADRFTGPQPEGVGVDRVLGKGAVVTEAIAALTARGRVRVEREEWRAEAADGGDIPVGTEVVVVGIEGTRLRVRPKASPDRSGSQP